MMELTFQDLKSVVIALLTMVLVYGFKVFWQCRTKKAMGSKLEELKTEQEWLERVGTSFEEAVLFSFRLVFIVLFLVGLGSIFDPFLTYLIGDGGMFELFRFSAWLLVLVAAYVSVSKLGKIRRYPQKRRKN
tara:strand:- start:1387 stop:1782 length:396 start_codon:yes stop_codon:yes gene_type:complete